MPHQVHQLATSQGEKCDGRGVCVHVPVLEDSWRQQNQDVWKNI